MKLPNNPKSRRSPALVFAIVFALCCCSAAAAQAQTTVFTYQGKFTDSSVAQPTTGTYTMTFRLYDAETGGNQIPNSSTAVTSMVSVAGGIFTTRLDFTQAAFNTSGARYLEIQVGSTVLTTRQEITGAPFSIRANSAANADSLGGLAANQYVQTTDARLTDNRAPTAGSTNYVQNTTAQQTANFNISGSGTVGGTLATNKVAVNGVLARGGAPGDFEQRNNGYAFNGNGGDNDSGLFSNANGRVSLYADNIERARADGSGLSVTGNLTSSGTLTIGSVASSGGTTPLCTDGANLVSACSRFSFGFTIAQPMNATLAHNLNTFDVMIKVYRSNGDGTWDEFPAGSNLVVRLLDANTFRLAIFQAGTYRVLVWR